MTYQQRYAVFGKLLPPLVLTTTAGSCWIDRPWRSQTAVVPPSTTNSIPLTKLESFEARNNATVAIS